MPRDWHDRHAVNKIEDDAKRQLYRSILSDKKPYFMRYIYPDLMRQYNTYLKNTNRKALREFQMTVDEMAAMPYHELSDEQKEFLRSYDKRMPVGTHDCVMNRICQKFEREFDGYISKNCSNSSFDYRFMRSPAIYTQKQFRAVKALFDDYNKRLVNHAIISDYERQDGNNASDIADINAEFRKACDTICSNSSALCNIVLDICYQKSSTKTFAWNVCGHEIISNLLSNNGNIIRYPRLDDNGDIRYGGNKFIIEEQELEVIE